MQLLLRFGASTQFTIRDHNDHHASRSLHKTVLPPQKKRHGKYYVFQASEPTLTDIDDGPTALALLCLAFPCLANNEATDCRQRWDTRLT